MQLHLVDLDASNHKSLQQTLYYSLQVGLHPTHAHALAVRGVLYSIGGVRGYCRTNKPRGMRERAVLYTVELALLEPINH